MDYQKKETNLNLKINLIYLKFIYMENIVLFYKNFLKINLNIQNFQKLKSSIQTNIFDIKNEDKNKKINLIFSPCAASFDNFKNFEERGRHFNYLINSYKIKNAR